MSTFSFHEDSDKVQWGKTLWLNLLRAFCAGIVWGVVMLITSFSNPLSGDTPPWYTLPLIFPFGFLFTLPMFLIVGKIFIAVMGDSGRLAVNFATILLGLGLIAGDPFVFVLHRIKPTLVPVEKFNFLNFALVIYVLDPTKAEP